jgi:prevent-host-death family protein
MDSSMRALKPSEDVIPVTDLKAHLSEVVRRVEESGRPVVLTRHGRGVLVLMSVHSYEEMQELHEGAELRYAVEEAEREIRAGHYVDGDVMEEKLERLAKGAS